MENIKLRCLLPRPETATSHCKFSYFNCSCQTGAASCKLERNWWQQQCHLPVLPAASQRNGNWNFEFEFRLYKWEANKLLERPVDRRCACVLRPPIVPQVVALIKRSSRGSVCARLWLDSVWFRLSNSLTDKAI